MPRQPDVKENKKAAMPAAAQTPQRLYMGTGSTELNLALTDHKDKGWGTGWIHNVVGDSSTGKTLLLLTALAEACYNPVFKDYELIYDDAESRNNFNLAKLFGSAAEKRIKREASEKVEQFDSRIHKLLKDGKKFIYVLDSWDALNTEADEEAATNRRKAMEENKKANGSYGTAKAKKASEILRELDTPISQSASLLIIVSQTRQAIGVTFAERTRSGGDALRFYASTEIWLSHLGFLERTVRKHKVKVGCHTRIRTKKNSQTGKYRDSEIFMYYEYGVDDIRSCLEFLIDWEFMAGTNGKYKLEELGMTGNMADLIQDIEEGEMIGELRDYVQQCWIEVESRIAATNRKPRFQ